MIPLFKVFNDRERALGNVAAVLESGYVGQGKWCDALEGDFNLLIDRRALYVNSGTSAIQLALYLSGAGPGTEVISTPVTCIATNAAIVANGARIVWADVDRNTGNIDQADAKRRVTNRTRAIIGVEWGGRPIDFRPIRESTRGVSLICDAAHSLCAERFGRADFECYSLQAIKLVNTADGGMLSCPSLSLHERAKLLRWFGLDRTRSDAMRCYQPINEVGWKMQGNDVLAAIGVANLAHAKSLSEKHRENAKALLGGLAGLRNVVAPPFDASSSYWLLTILVSSPAAFESFMAKRGVMVSQVHARNDIYGCFRDFAATALPGVDYFCGHQVSIPVGWWLQQEDLNTIIGAVKEWDSTAEARWEPE